MKRTFQLSLVLAACLVVAGAPSVWASCAGIDSQAVRHNGLGGVIEHCKDNLPVNAYIYALSTPATVNSAGQNIVCNDSSITFPDTFLPCNLVPECGVPGDGLVTLYYEFGQGNPGSLGCPNPGGTGGDGFNPMVVHIVCNDGASLLYTLGYSINWQGYNMDGASDPSGANVAANYANGPSFVSYASNNLCVRVPVPTVMSDCGSVFDSSSCGDPAARPAAGRGKLYTKEALCGSSPDPRNAAWTALPNLPDATGLACNIVNKPTLAGQCTYVGATGTFGANETPAMIGYLQIPGPGAANDKVKIDNAAFNQGKLVVAFSTTNETSIVGFNVYSDAQKLNGSLIGAKGTGSNAYSYEVGRGALKGGKSVLVEAVKSDGTVEKSDPVALK